MTINSTRAALAVISTAPGAAAWRLGSSLPMRLDDDALTPPLGGTATTNRLRVLSVTHGNPSLEEISLSDGQFGPIYPSLADIPRVTDSRG